MKLKDLTYKQVVQTTEENHEAFMELLDKQGFKWYNGDSYLNDIYQENHLYNVKKGGWCDKDWCIKQGYEIIPASKFLKPSKKELLERIERLEKSVFPINQTTEPTEPKVGDLCAFADDESGFEGDVDGLLIRILGEIRESNEYRYVNSKGYCYRFARKVEIKFI